MSGSGRGRKRKSLWDCIGEPQLPAQISEKDALHEKGSCSDLNVGHDPKWSDLEDGNAKGNVSQKEDKRDLNDFPDSRKPWDGDKSPHVSSAFDRLEPQNRSRSPENSRNLSSRNRDRDRGRSRSPSRGRGRSRDRDWDRGKGRSQSRSPLGNYRKESYRWTDRRTGLGGLASQPCRDFASGKCRRGSECRFLHQDNLDHKDGGRSEVERSERWRTAQERGGNGYNGEKDGPMRSSGKSTALCNDFMKGRCHRGSSCKFSHDDRCYNSERGNRDSSFDHDYKRQPHTNGNTPCKFFMMGNCNRENCRFSHDGPVQGYTQGKSQVNTWGKDFDDMKNSSWKGPKWGEATAVSDVSQSTGWSNVGKQTFIDEMNKPWSGPKWGEATAVPDVSLLTSWGNIELETFIDPATAEKKTDDRRGHSLEDKNKSCLKWGDATGVSEIGMSTGWGNTSAENTTLADLAYAEKHPDVAKSSDSEDPLRSPHCLQSLTPLQISKDVSEQITGHEASGRLHRTTVMHSVFPEDSIFQQRQNQVGDSNEMTDDFNLLTGVDVYASAPHPDFLPVQNNNKITDSFPSVGGIDQSQHIVSVNPSNGLDIDLNGSVRQNYSPSNLKNQSQIQHGESVHKIVNTCPLNVVNNEQVGQISTFPLSLMQIIGNGQLPQLYAALNPPNSIESMSSLPHSANLLPTVTSMNIQPDPASIFQKQCNPIPDSIDCTSNDAIEQNSAMLLKCPSPPSTIGFDSVKLHKNDFPEDNSQRSPELRQQKTVADSGYEENHISTAEKRKLEQENMRTGNVDVRPRILDGNIEKDEKTMRLFKIALVEFVKEILKPKWKEGQMTREVHKNIVKKVVDKVTSTIQGANIPKTQDKIDQYLSYSKPKLTKLVEAYTEKFSKCP